MKINVYNVFWIAIFYLFPQKSRLETIQQIKNMEFSK